MREYRRAYKQRNLGKQAEYRARRRAQQKNLPWEPIDRARVYARDEGWCYLCGLFVLPEVFHMDHVIPIAGGGPHLYSNVATTHALCNYRKNALPASRWGVAA